MTATDPRSVLDLPLDPGNDSGATTVRGYLTALLETLWREEEGFSGKRPFGSSSWQYDLYVPMARAGLIEGVGVDGDGELSYEDWVQWKAARRKADDLIVAAIRALGEMP